MLTPVDEAIAFVLWQNLTDLGDVLRQPYKSQDGQIWGVYIVQKTWQGYDVRWTRHRRAWGTLIEESKHSQLAETPLDVIEILKHGVFYA